MFGRWRCPIRINTLVSLWLIMLTVLLLIFMCFGVNRIDSKFFSENEVSSFRNYLIDPFLIHLWMEFFQTPSQEAQENLQMWRKWLRQKIKGYQLNFLSVFLVYGGDIWILDKMIQTGNRFQLYKNPRLGNYMGNILVYEMLCVQRMKRNLESRFTVILS